MAGITGGGVSLHMILLFLITLAASVLILYSFLLSLTALVFWNPGFLFTWVFDSLFQLARYPVTVYPPWLRMVLTWVVPVGIMTTLPATALTTTLAFQSVVGFILLSMVALILASFFFNRAVIRYSSASS
jgi:ABC-2 type transport system permease protein